jgi:hypothetical protein
LLRAKGHYYNLYTKQFRDELEMQLDPFAAKPNSTNGNGHHEPKPLPQPTI